MNRLALTLCALLAASLVAQRPNTSHTPSITPSTDLNPAVGFVAFDIWIDPGGNPLAVYELEITLKPADAPRTDVPSTARIVGIEGGDHAQFTAAPYYDPMAMQAERIVIGALSTASPATLPTGRTRIARIHVMVDGPIPELTTNLRAAGDSQGRNLDAHVSIEPAVTGKGAL